MLRVLVVADVRLVREALLSAFRGESDIEVVAASAADVIAAVRSDVPDVVIVPSPGAGACALIRAVVGTVPTVTVLAIGADAADGDVIRCVEAGVSGFVDAEASNAELITAVRQAAGGVLQSPRHVVDLVFRHLARGPRALPTPERTRLSLREVEIARLAMAGRSNKEIASSLFIEVATVKNHVHAILDKLGVTRRSEISANLLQRPVSDAPDSRDDWQRAS